MFRRLIQCAVIVLVVAASALASLKAWIDGELARPLAVPENGYVLEVPAGATLSQVSRRLAGEGIVRSPYPLLIYARFSDVPPIMVGDYAIAEGDSMATVLDKLTSGDVIRFPVTFPEGLTVAQWLVIVNGHDLYRDREPLTFGQLQENFSPPRALLGDGVDKLALSSLEGWFFPDTYLVSGRESALDIFRQAHERMVELLEQEWQNRVDGLPLTTPYEALTLASIIEKETGVPDERQAIAGVFVRRLQKGMRLQTDPTIIYGLGERYAGNITRAHLREATAYNTYVIDGLPPTPIANPGRAAIHAALNPAEGEALYFVARGDGSHQFSATLEEHRRAVRQYQLQRTDNYRSSPN